MTEQNMQSLRDDLAYLRALAAEGQQAPLMGGGILAAAGGVFGLASLAHWAVVAGVLHIPGWALMAIWLTATAVFMVALFALKAHYKTRPGAQTSTNRAAGSAWMGVGFACFALFVAFFLASYQTGLWQIMNLFAPVILSLYGAAWTVAAQMTRRRWIWALAMGSFAAAILTAGLVGRPEQYLAYAASLVLLAFVPGVIAMRAEPSDVV